MDALIDGDVLEYEAGFAAQKTRYYLDGDWFEDYDSLLTHCEAEELDVKELKAAGRVESEIEVFPESVAINTARSKLSAVLGEVGVDVKDGWTIVFSGEDNFREDVAVTKKYKGNRDDKPKPYHFELVRDWLRNGPMTEGKTVITDGHEADDFLSICQHRANYKNVVCSIDKDLCQIPGRHYNWRKGIKFKVSREQGLWFFMAQLLMGDSVDNIPGIPRIGEVKAYKLLEPYRGQGREGLQQAWNEVLSIYREKKDDEYLEEQGQLLWMLRSPEERWNISLMEKEIDKDV